VIIQVPRFKLTGKRVFQVAPIHPHFELIGWSEPKVIARFSSWRSFCVVQPDDAEAAVMAWMALLLGPGCGWSSSERREAVCGRALAARKGARVTLTDMRETIDEAESMRAGGSSSSSVGHRPETLCRRPT